MRGIFTTPRPVPGRLVPAAAGALVVVLGLPVFLAAGWPLAAWGLTAVLWAAGEAFYVALGRLPLGADNLASSGVAGVGMTLRGIAIMVVLIAVTVADRDVGIPAVGLYVVAYTVELGVSLASYFAGSRS